MTNVYYYSTRTMVRRILPIFLFDQEFTDNDMNLSRGTMKQVPQDRRYTKNIDQCGEDQRFIKQQAGTPLIVILYWSSTRRSTMSGCYR